MLKSPKIAPKMNHLTLATIQLKTAPKNAKITHRLHHLEESDTWRITKLSGSFFGVYSH